MRKGGEGRSRVLLITLIVTALFLITLDLRGIGVIESARKGIQSILSPFQRAGNVVLSPVKNFFLDVANIGQTREQIEKLRADNAKLKEQLINRKNADAQLNQLKGILDLAGTARYKIVNAQVISYGSSQSFSQSVTINVGSKAGIRRNMTVLSESGIAGVVKEVYPQTSIILLATDPSFRIGIRVAGTQQIGILSGHGSRSGSLQMIDNLTSVKVGDILLSRGSIANRPFVPGVPVGYVSGVDNSPGSIAQSATVRLYTNFSRLSVVAVVVGGPQNNPGDALIPVKPQPTPIPTVTIYLTPTPAPTS